MVRLEKSVHNPKSLSAREKTSKLIALTKQIVGEDKVLCVGSEGSSDNPGDYDGCIVLDDFLKNSKIGVYSFGNLLIVKDKAYVDIAITLAEAYEKIIGEEFVVSYPE